MPGIRSAADASGVAHPALIRTLLRGGVVCGFLVAGWLLGAATGSADSLIPDDPGQLVIDEARPAVAAVPVSPDRLLPTAGDVVERTVPVPLPAPAEILEPVRPPVQAAPRETAPVPAAVMPPPAPGPAPPAPGPAPPAPVTVAAPPQLVTSAATPTTGLAVVPPLEPAAVPPPHPASAVTAGDADDATSRDDRPGAAPCRTGAATAGGPGSPPALTGADGHVSPDFALRPVPIAPDTGPPWLRAHPPSTSPD